MTPDSRYRWAPAGPSPDFIGGLSARCQLRWNGPRIECYRTGLGVLLSVERWPKAGALKIVAEDPDRPFPKPEASRVLAKLIPGIRGDLAPVGPAWGIEILPALEDNVIEEALAGLPLESRTFDCDLGIGLTLTNRSARLSALRPLLFHADYGTPIDPMRGEELLEWLCPEASRGPVLNRMISCHGALERPSVWHERLVVFRSLVNGSLRSIFVTLREAD